MASALKPAAVIRIIRFAMLAGIILTGVVLAFVRDTTRLTVPDPWSAVLVYLFAASLFGGAIGVLILRGIMNRSSSPVSQMRLCIIGYALVEVSAILGALYLFFTGVPYLFLTGLVAFVAVLFLLRIPEEAIERLGQDGRTGIRP
jgi:Co/Zn/Cd efflux system component